MTVIDGRVPAFVGRAQELSIMRSRLESSLAGGGRFVLLAGEAGIGKTRLCQEFRQHCALDGVPVSWGRCFEGEWTPPFSPWAEVLEALRLRLGHERLAELAGRDRALLARLVPALEGDAPHRAVESRLPPEEARFRFVDAVMQVLARVATIEPFVIVLDDLHWADHGSMRLLSHLARFVDRIPLMVVGTYRNPAVERSEPLTQWLPEARRADQVAFLPLTGLARQDMLELLAANLRSPVRPAVLDEIITSSVGNPFFAGELIRQAQVEVSWRPTRNGALPKETGIPDSIRETVERRLSRCSPPTQRMLNYLSIFVGGFSFPVVQAFLAIDEQELLDALDEGLRSGFLQGVDTQTETYEFVHEIVRRVLSDGWTPSRRIRLHRTLAESLERVYAGDEHAHAGELATQYHASAALPGAERGIAYAIEAAEQARSRFAWERAAAFLEMALLLTRRHAPEREGTVITRLAIAQAQALAIDDALDSVDRAIPLMRAANEAPETIARFIAEAAAAIKDDGADASRWKPLVLQGLELLNDRRDLTWARLTLLLERFAPISSGAIYSGRWEGVDAGALAMARTEGDEEDYARTLQPFQWRSREETDALRARVRTWRQPAAINRALMMIGADLIYTHGAFRDAPGFFREMIATAEQTGSIVTQCEALIRLAVAQLALGEFADAALSAQEAGALLHRLPPTHRLHPSFRWVQALRAELVDGEWEPIARYWTAFVADPAHGESAIVLDDAALAALAHLRAGNVDEGTRLLAALNTALRPLDASVWLLNGAVGFGGQVVWELERSEDARLFADLSHSLIEQGRNDYPGCSNRLTLARMLALNGEMDSARAEFARARTALRDSGQRPLLAIVDLDEAKALLLHKPADAERREAAALIQRGLDSFAELGMPRWIERGAALLDTLETTSHGHRRGSTLPAGLTERELDILRLVARGYSDRRISEELYLSPRTVHTHLRHMLNKTTLSNRTELSVWAVERGLVPR